MHIYVISSDSAGTTHVMGVFTRREKAEAAFVSFILKHPSIPLTIYEIEADAEIQPVVGHT